MTTTDYLSRDLRRARLSLHQAEKKHNTPESEMQGLRDKIKYLKEALAEALAAVQGRDLAGKPLTLEQLRKMGEKPVWVQDLEHPDKSQWRLCHWDRGKYLVLQGISLQGYILEDYGKAWIAYAYTPPHLDRDAWEPCGACKLPVDLSYWMGMSCKYCPHCGRPLTDAAWAELESERAHRQKIHRLERL